MEFGGNDLLQVYNGQQIKHRLNSTGMYVANTKVRQAPYPAPRYGRPLIPAPMYGRPLILAPRYSRPLILHTRYGRPLIRH